MSITIEPKILFDKNELCERYKMSWNTLKAKLINNGVLPQGRQFYSGKKLFWTIQDVKKADEAIIAQL